MATYPGHYPEMSLRRWLPVDCRRSWLPSCLRGTRCCRVTGSGCGCGVRCTRPLRCRPPSSEWSPADRTRRHFNVELLIGFSTHIHTRWLVHNPKQWQDLKRIHSIFLLCTSKKWVYEYFLIDCFHNQSEENRDKKGKGKWHLSSNTSCTLD